MSQAQNRNRNALPRAKPNILGRARKRKNSENGDALDGGRDVKQARLEATDMPTLPLGDVTSSLNITTREPSPDSTQLDTSNKFRGTIGGSLHGSLPSPAPEPLSQRTPLPRLGWADRDQVWALMCRKDRLYPRNPHYLHQHKSLQPRMRAILLDWLTEVCEVYKLHRETYYLAVDYIDRYLSASQDVPKQQLQLIGITCLFIAAKIEEIYPPKQSEFAYVTDGACMESEILDKELVILKKLNWDLCPVTSNCWLNTYLQLALLRSEAEENPSEKPDDSKLVFPKYSPLTFVNAARLLDLCSLDMTSLGFTSSMVAAGVLYYICGDQVATAVTGYTQAQLAPVCDWMLAFYYTIYELEAPQLKAFSQVSQDDIHNIQTHAVDLDTLEQAQIRLSEIQSSARQSPDCTGSTGMLTPPKTDEKTRYST